ncbi:MAG: SDR family oxidoreductase [Firmicutes bacterium]|nr:SDR family oxidoreductase [Bacillota bacterium]
MNIFITGGTRGIGKGMVSEFLKLGHNVSFTGTSSISVQKGSSGLSGNFVGYVCDVRDMDQIMQSMEQAVSNFGPIDIWINNAGIDQARKPVSELTSGEIKDVIDVNVVGMIHGTKVALSEMKKQGYGAIYNMEGLGSDDRMIPETVIYGSSKRLLRYFSRACNKELKEYPKIFVGTLSPGMVFTDLLLNNSTEESLKIMNILGNKVEEVTPFLVKKMLQGKKRIYWLTTRKVMFKFMRSMVRKNK